MALTLLIKLKKILNNSYVKTKSIKTKRYLFNKNIKSLKTFLIVIIILKMAIAIKQGTKL